MLEKSKIINVTLEGSEYKVSGLSGFYAEITNLTGHVVYASTKPGIAPGNKDVMTVLSGEKGIIAFPFNSKDLYLLGEGSVHILGTDYPTDSFIPSNPNLLINPDFRINQRGKTGTITDIGYFVDRWQLTNGSVTINSDGSLTLNGTIKQILEEAIGNDVTATSSAGTVTYDNNNQTFALTASGETITWVKLELGSFATPFVTPSLATELVKCQRFFYTVPYGRDRLIGNVTSDGVGIVFLPLPTTIRSMPTITNADGSEVKMQVTNGGNSILSDVSVAQVTSAPNGILFTLNSDSFFKGQTIIAYHQRAEDNSPLAMYISSEL